MSAARRNPHEILEDLAEAIDAAAELVAIGKDRWDRERPLRLAGEAIVGRLGDIATKLPSELVADTSELPWTEIKGMRIVVDHAYHGMSPSSRRHSPVTGCRHSEVMSVQTGHRGSLEARRCVLAVLATRPAALSSN